MKERIKILYICQEIKPYVPEDVIANVCRELPQHVQENGCEIRTFMPCYGHVNERRNQLHEVQRLSGMNLIIDDSDHPLIIKVASIQAARMQVYFIDNDDYFKRKGVFSNEKDGEFVDNDERSIFFVRGVLETIKKLRWTPDIIHCHGWFSATAPVYIKKVYDQEPFFANSKVVYSAYNLPFENMMRKGFDKRIVVEGIEAKDVKAVKGKEISPLMVDKLGVDFSDAVIGGSEELSEDLLKYIKKKKIPFLPAPKENYMDAYMDFYKTLVEKGEE